MLVAVTNGRIVAIKSKARQGACFLPLALSVVAAVLNAPIRGKAEHADGSLGLSELRTA